MKQRILTAILAMAVLLAAAPLMAATPISGAKTAQAGTGGVTSGLLVKLESAGVIITATAVTDSVVGVCEQTASADALTKYAPVGTQTTVTSGELISVGDLLTAGAGGKAFVLDTDDASTQRVAAIALTAASGADEDVTVVVVSAAAEQRLALASLAVGGGYGSTGVSISAAGAIQADDAITSDSTITGGSLTDGTVTIASGSVTGTWVDLGSITTADLNGGTIDAATIGGATPGAVTGTTITGTTLTDGTISTTAGSVTGTWVDLGAITTADLNGGTIDGVTIGAAAAPTVTDLGAVATCDINGGSIDGVTIGAAAAGAITGTTITGTTLTDGTISTTAGAVTGALDISGATVTYRAIVNADISASADIARSKLAEEALAAYSVPFTALRNASGLALVAAAEDDEFGITLAGFGTGTLTIDGDPASGESETSTLMFEFTLPPEYVASGDVTLVVEARESVGAATVATTISAEVYEDDGQGGVSADLYNAFDATDVTAVWATHTAVITDADLVAGDKIRVFVRIVTNDTGAAVGTVAQIGEIQIQCDIKG